MSMFPTMADSAADTVRVKNIVFEMGSGASQVLLSLGNVFRVLPSMSWFFCCCNIAACSEEKNVGKG